MEYGWIPKDLLYDELAFGTRTAVKSNRDVWKRDIKDSFIDPAVDSRSKPMEASCQDKHWDVYVGRECTLNYVTHGLSPVTSGRKPAAPDSGCSATVDTADLRQIKV